MNTPKKHDIIRQLFKSFILSTDYPAYSKIDHTGLWRLLMIRTNEKGEAMALLQVNPKYFSSEALDDLKEKLSQFIKEKNNEEYNCRCIHRLNFHLFHLLIYLQFSKICLSSRI